MISINLELPDSILASYSQNPHTINSEIKRAFIIWEYLGGHLSLKQSADALNLSYRSFLDLLWSRGISADALNSSELEQQYNDLAELLK